MIRRIFTGLVGIVGLTLGLGCCHVAGFNDCERGAGDHALRAGSACYGNQSVETAPLGEKHVK